MPRPVKTQLPVAHPPAPTTVNHRSQWNVRPSTRLNHPGESSSASEVASLLPVVTSTAAGTHTAPSVPTSSARTQLPICSSSIEAITQVVTQNILQSFTAQGLPAATTSSAVQPSGTPFQLSNVGGSTTSPGILPEADTAVQGSVASVLGNLSGENMGAEVLAPARDRPGDVFTPMSLSIDSCVPAKLKAKIWAHEYFDFGLLLINSPIEQ